MIRQKQIRNPIRNCSGEKFSNNNEYFFLHSNFFRNMLPLSFLNGKFLLKVGICFNESRKTCHWRNHQVIQALWNWGLSAVEHQMTLFTWVFGLYIKRKLSSLKRVSFSSTANYFVVLHISFTQVNIIKVQH